MSRFFVSPPKPPRTPLKLDEKKEEPVGKQEKTAMEKKVINDAVAYIKSIAQLRKRNIPWAIEAVVEGKSISALDALEKNVIDLMAYDVSDLLDKDFIEIVKRLPETKLYIVVEGEQKNNLKKIVKETRM